MCAQMRNFQMKKGCSYVGTVKEIDFPNKGRVVCDEGEALVKGVLPGQEVAFTVNRKKSGKCFGRLDEITKRSPLETAVPACPNFYECGGCSYQTLEYGNQLLLKESMVKKILDNAVDHEFEFEGIIASPNVFGYRNKMEFSFGDEFKDGPLALGLHRRSSFYDIVTASECRIVNEDFTAILKETLSVCREFNLPHYHKLRHDGYLRHLVIRRGEKTGEILAAIVTTSRYPGGQDRFLDELKNRLLRLELSGKINGILHVVNDSLSDTVQSDRTEILYGRDYIYDIIGDLKFKISLFSFFQTNTSGASHLYEKAAEYVGRADGKTVFDLYCGTGTIAQIAAGRARRAVGVEIVEEAVVAARENAAANGIENCEFIAGDVLKVVDELKEKPDIIILDPPREGINPKALKKIAGFGAKKIVYISCKPTSLSRDLAEFEDRGYVVEKASAVDMFPQTVHVETVILLSGRKADAFAEVESELNELNPD